MLPRPTACQKYFFDNSSHFGLAQEETIKLGQTDTDGTLFDIAAITLYSGNFIGLEIGGLDMTFEVSEDTADYLNGYFE